MVEVKNRFPVGRLNFTNRNARFVRRKILVTDATFQHALTRPGQFVQHTFGIVDQSAHSTYLEMQMTGSLSSELKLFHW
jgi:hypothetical protein